MKIAFVSVRGIPNMYGGFEQFAEYISVGLAKRGHEVTVYSPSYHAYKGKEYKGVRIKHIYSPEKWIGGSIGSFFYDFLSLKDAIKHECYDIIYEAGYTSIVPAFIWFDVKNIKGPIIVTNMDGLEWKRSKFSKPVQKFIEWEEKMAVKHSQFLIADNMGIHDYSKEKFGKESKFLAYGADIHIDYKESVCTEFDVKPYEYYIVVARLEPENNLTMAIEGYRKSKEYGKRPLIIVGKTNTPFGKKLVKLYGKDQNIRLIGGLYDFKKLDSLRHYALAYFHGHSVGGTNPSLLEAMASGCFVMAHDNIFNKAVLKENAYYYKSSNDVSSILNDIEKINVSGRQRMIEENIEEVRNNYSWEKLLDEHEKYFYEILSKK